jgi:hypothetical protein
MMGQPFPFDHKTYGFGKPYGVMRYVGYRTEYALAYGSSGTEKLTGQEEHVTLIHINVLEFPIVHHFDQQLTFKLIKPFLQVGSQS